MRWLPVVTVLGVALVVSSLPIMVEGWSAARQPVVSALTLEDGSEEESRTREQETLSGGSSAWEGDHNASDPARASFIPDETVEESAPSERQATEEAASSAVHTRSSPMVPASATVPSQTRVDPTVLTTPTSEPTRAPSVTPTAAVSPTPELTETATAEPTATRTPVPTAEPTKAVTPEPTTTTQWKPPKPEKTPKPTPEPTETTEPTEETPTPEPTEEPTETPSPEPTETAEPTETSTTEPSTPTATATPPPDDEEDDSGGFFGLFGG